MLRSYLLITEDIHNSLLVDQQPPIDPDYDPNVSIELPNYCANSDNSIWQINCKINTKV